MGRATVLESSTYLRELALLLASDNRILRPRQQEALLRLSDADVFRSRFL